MNDLISRMSLKQSIKASAMLEELKTLDQIIDEEPSIDAVPNGRWIKHVIKNANVPWGYDCSVCGGWFVINEQAVERYNFCPNCGAKMERKED